MSGSPPRYRVAALVLGSCVALPGCSPGAPAAPATPMPPSAEQRVGLTEWEILTEGRPFPPGTVRLRVTNAGAAPHDLAVRVGDEELAASPVLDTGEAHELVFTAPAGQRVELWCTVTGHHAAGMTTTVEVAAAGAAP